MLLTITLCMIFVNSNCTMNFEMFALKLLNLTFDLINPSQKNLIKLDPTLPNPTRGLTQPMDNSARTHALQPSALATQPPRRSCLKYASSEPHELAE